MEKGRREAGESSKVCGCEEEDSSLEEEGREEVAGRLKQLRRERDLLKEAQVKVEMGENLYPSVRALVLKWKKGNEVEGRKPKGKQRVKQDDRTTTTSTTGAEAELPCLLLRGLPSEGEGRRRTKGKTKEEEEGEGEGRRRRKSRTNEAEALMRNLEKSFRLAREEEERLKEELKAMKGKGKREEEEEERKGEKKEGRRAHVKLKKSKTGSIRDYKYASMKKKYKDVLLYLATIEEETTKLKKENEVLHSALKEEDRFDLRQRVAMLEQEIMNRDTYVKECENVVRNFNQLHEENVRLKNVIQASLNEYTKEKEEDDKGWTKEGVDRRREKEEAEKVWINEKRKTGEENDRMKEELEREFLHKLNDTKMVYEKAISGYKEELSTARERLETLQLEMKVLVEGSASKEKEMVEAFENEMRKLKAAAESNEAQKRSEGATLLQLETIICNKDVEVGKLREELDVLRAEAKRSEGEKFEQRLCAKLEQLLAQKKSKESEEESAWLPLKETLKTCFEDLERKNEEGFRKRETFLLDENERLKDHLKCKEVELSALKKELEEAKKEVDKWALKCEFIESKATETADVKEELKELRLRLRESEAKVSEVQSERQNCVIETNILGERLQKSETEVDAKRTFVSDLEQRLRDASYVNKTQDQDAEKLEDKIERLEAQIEKKNKILEKNSIQLEERIREYSSLATRMELSREDYQKQILLLKSNIEDSNQDSKLRDLQSQNAKLESQLRVVRTEKSHHDKSKAREMRMLQDQVSQLKLRNATLQKHLDVIQVTYKSMFAFEGHNGLPNGATPSQLPSSCPQNLNFEMLNQGE